MEKQDTIAAISTAQAPGGIGVIRLSGWDAGEIADRIFKTVSGEKLQEKKGYTAAFGSFYSLQGEKLDEGVALCFKAPRSYTGENVVELSCHGGLYITRRILQEVLAAGAKPAGPGEFTKRAFLNGKMDLTQAEAVMEIISANGEQAARAALAAGSGHLSTRIRSIRGKLMELAVHLSAWADFPEEEVPEVEEQELLSGLQEAKSLLSQLLSGFDTGKIFREGIETVIAGRPNAGKSTLMNLLSGCQKSIVTEYAGTTRDIVEETVLLGGIPLRLADTAGIRDTDDPVESIGVQAARDRVKTAQLVLAVFDSSQPITDEDRELAESLQTVPCVAIINKTDLETVMDVQWIKEHFSYVVSLSASTGDGLSQLTETLSQVLHTENFDPQSGVLTTERQRKDAQTALDAVTEGLQALKMGLTFDAVTVCVEDSIQALSSLTGEHVSEEIVDQVFEQFCVGK